MGVVNLTFSFTAHDVIYFKNSHSQFLTRVSINEHVIE